MARAKLIDAQVLCEHRRYHGAVYLCGYAIEFALKARICSTLRWVEYKLSGDYSNFKTHDLKVLLNLAGQDTRVRGGRLRAHWASVEKWKVESRYDLPGKTKRTDAQSMIDAASELLEAL